MAELDVAPLNGGGFGGLVRGASVGELEDRAGALLDAFHARHGLLVLSGFEAISEDPGLLVRLSRLFGAEVEDYRRTLTAANKVHTEVPEILVISNTPPASQPPPARPEPPLAADGSFPVQFPHRRGWHTDQSYRRPPPDISLFYCVKPAANGQAQTLYADGIAAYATLPEALKARIAGVEALHVQPGTGRSEYAVRAGETPRPLAPHERPQCQPLVRIHPVTGEPALYLCEAGQLDWIDGPIAGLSPGPDGDGAALVYELMAHFTRPEFVHVQEWSLGDLVIYDNRCTIHAATWFDADRHDRMMWRTTVWGNPGPDYAGEARSWLPA